MIFHDLQDFCNAGTVPVINGSNLKQQRVFLAEHSGSAKTAEMVDAWDNSIELARQLIAAKEQHYAHELSRLISRGHYPRGHVGSFAHEVSERNRGGNEARPERYKFARLCPAGRPVRAPCRQRRLVQLQSRRRGQYAYNPSRINVGSIARLDAWDDGC